MLDAPPTLDKTMVAPKWGVEYTENLTGSPKGTSSRPPSTIVVFFLFIGQSASNSPACTFILILDQISLQDLQYHPLKVPGLDP